MFSENQSSICFKLFSGQGNKLYIRNLENLNLLNVETYFCYPIHGIVSVSPPESNLILIWSRNSTKILKFGDELNCTEISSKAYSTSICDVSPTGSILFRSNRCQNATGDEKACESTKLLYSGNIFRYQFNGDQEKGRFQEIIS